MSNQLPENPNEVDFISIANNMIKFGGSFVRKLGEALLSADIQNRKKLLETFPEYFAKYNSILSNPKKNKFKYIFSNEVESLEGEGNNLFGGAKNAGIKILTADNLTTEYLHSTIFEDRVHRVFGLKDGEKLASLYTVRQSHNKQ